MGDKLDRERWLGVALLTTIATMGAALLLFCGSRWGAGMNADAVIYVTAARNLLAGKGLSTYSLTTGQLAPLTITPPLYPALLALTGQLGLDPFEGARWFNAFFYAANIILAGLIIRRYTRSLLTSLYGALIILTTHIIIVSSAMAMTETFFLFLNTLGLFWLAEYFFTQKKRFFYGAAIIAGLGLLTRFTGVPLIGTGVIALLLFGDKKLSNRFTESVIFGALCSLPTVLWFIRNAIIAGNATSRAFNFHLISPQQLLEVPQTLSRWLFLGHEFSGTRLILLILAVTILLVGIYVVGEKNAAYNKYRRQRPNPFPNLVMIFSLTYLAFLAVSISFFDVSTGLDERMLVPVYIVCVILLLCKSHHHITTHNNARVLKSIFVGLCVLFVLLNARQGAGALMYLKNKGFGMSGEKWSESIPIMEELRSEMRKLPEGALFYTNAPDVIYFLTGQVGLMLPIKQYPRSLLMNESYDAEMTLMEERLRNKTTYLLYLRNSSRGELPSEKRLNELLPLTPVKEDRQGTIYSIKIKK